MTRGQPGHPRAERPSDLGFADLDPFALPTETEGRYRILIAAALVLVWSAASFAVPGLEPSQAGLELPPQHREIQSKIVAGGIESLSPDERETVADPDIAAPYVRAMARWLARITISIALLVVTVLGAVAVYRLHPRWRGLLRSMSPLSDETAPEVVRDLRRLMRRAGLPDGISLVSTDGQFDGLALGTGGRVTIALGCPSGLLSTAWARVMRPVAFHELGHIANRDIRHQEISRGVWIAALALLVLLGLGRIAVVGVESIAPLSLALVRSLPFLLGIAWMWRGLVRTREHYADLRAVAWGEREGLLRRLRTGPAAPSWWEALPDSAERALRRYGIWRFLERLREHGWSFHPTRAERAAVIENPRPLFEVSNELALSTGLLLTAVLGSMGLLFEDLVLAARTLMSACVLFFGRTSALAVIVFALAAMMALSHLVTGALGIQVQREAVAHAAVQPGNRWGYVRQGRVALFFALGIELGLLATPASLLSSEVLLLMGLAWLLAFTALTWMWLVVLRALSRLLLSTRAGTRPPGRSRTLVTWLSSLLLAVLYGPALAARSTLHRLAELPHQDTLGGASPEPIERFLIVFVMSSLVLLTVGLALYAAIGLLSVAIAAVRLIRHRPACSACGSLGTARLVAGARCTVCSEALAPWLLLDLEPASGDPR